MPFGLVFVAVRMKNGFGRKTDCCDGCIRPENSGYFFAVHIAGSDACIAGGLIAFLRFEHSNMTGFVQDIAGIKQLLRIDEKDAVFNIKSRQERFFTNRFETVRQADPVEKSENGSKYRVIWAGHIFVRLKSRKSARVFSRTCRKFAFCFRMFVIYVEQTLIMSTLLDVAISLAFIFLLFSILVSGASELFQMLIRKRASYLFNALSAVFNDRLNKNYTQMLYDHPLIDRLKEKETTNPHYIPVQSFADALIDVIRSDHKLPKIRFDKTKKAFAVEHIEYSQQKNEKGEITGVDVVKDFREGIEAMNESDLKHLLRTFTFGVNDYNGLKAAISTWFNDYMDATSTGYKRYMTRTLFIIGCVVAVSFNIDAISLTKNLYKDKGLRDRVVEAAVQYANKQEAFRADSAQQAKLAEARFQRRKKADSLRKAGLTQMADSVRRDTAQDRMNLQPPVVKRDTVKKDTTVKPMTEDERFQEDVRRESKKMKDAYDEVNVLKLPIGWSLPEDCDCNHKAWYCSVVLIFIMILKSIPGWLITAGALSYGADNWFNLLVRLINVRTSVKPKDEPVAKSKDAK